MVLERTKESDLTRMLRFNNIRIVDAPLRPGAPIRPQVAFNIGAGSFVGILLGVAAALARAMIDRTVKTPDDVEKEVGLTFIGLLPEIGEETLSLNYGKKRRRKLTAAQVKRPELIVHEHPMSGIAEAARTIRTNLLFMAPDRPFQTLLVTSAGPSEGKTTVACCIAIAMAQAGQRVVLIDCDLRKPRIHRVFGKDSTVGVTTALLEESIDHAVLDSGVPNLSVIPAGPIPPNPAELLHSERFKHFLEQVQGRFNRVILDSPPVVPVTDGVVLSTLVDGTILVVRAFKTTKDSRASRAARPPRRGRQRGRHRPQRGQPEQGRVQVLALLLLPPRRLLRRARERSPLRRQPQAVRAGRRRATACVITMGGPKAPPTPPDRAGPTLL